MGVTDRPVKRDSRIWAGLLLLVLGLFLADRAFALWRNDPRNFAHWDGSHLTDAQLTALGTPRDPQQRRFQDHRMLATVEAVGLVCIVSSCFLLAGLGTCEVRGRTGSRAKGTRETLQDEVVTHS